MLLGILHPPGQDLALAFAELHEAHESPFLQRVEVPGSPGTEKVLLGYWKGFVGVQNLLRGAGRGLQDCVKRRGKLSGTTQRQSKEEIKVKQGGAGVGKWREGGDDREQSRAYKLLASTFVWVRPLPSHFLPEGRRGVWLFPLLRDLPIIKTFKGNG